MAVQVILKNSAVQDKEATASQLALGEIALNYHSSGPFLQCEDSAGNVWRIGGVVIASSAPSNPSRGAWWLDSNDDHLYLFDGSSWVEIQTGEIAPSDIADGTARQLLQTSADGTTTEWTSNVDVPGTLDVTGNAVFDSNLTVSGTFSADVAVSSLIDGTARQLIQTAANGTDVEWTSNIDIPGTLDVTGDATFDSAVTVVGTLTIPAGSIANAEIDTNAEIAVSKLANGSARQLLQTAANGTDVEWASNLDVPGTLDVTSTATFDSNVVISGDLTVSGTTTTLDTQNLLVEDKNIEIGRVTSPTDVTANGGGITLKGTTDKTILWSDSTDNWTFNQAVDLGSGLSYKINNTEVLSSTTLGSGVTGSSLTSVGTISSGVWQGTAIGTAYLPAGSTSSAGILQLTDATNSTSTTTAATANAVKAAYDLASTGLTASGGTITGALNIGSTGSLVFEGATDDAFELTLAVTDPTADRTATLPDASTVLAGLAVAQTFTKAQRGSISAFSSSSGTATADFSLANNFSITLSETTLIGNPTNIVAGQSGVIFITQDSTPRAVSWGSYWDFSSVNNPPSVSTGSGALDLLVYVCRSSTSIQAQLLTNFS